MGVGVGRGGGWRAIGGGDGGAGGCEWEHPDFQTWRGVILARG